MSTTEGGQSGRVSGVAVIRAVSFVCIVLQHVIGAVPAMPDKGVHSMPAIIFTLFVTRFAVPAFIMCAGYVAVASARKSTLAVFWQRRLKSVLLPYALWGIGYWLWSMRLGSGGGTQLEILWRGLVGLVSGTHCYHLWFMVMLVQLYLVLPILIRLMDRWRYAGWVIVLSSIVLAVAWNQATEARAAWAQGPLGPLLAFSDRLLPPWLMYALFGVQAARLGFLTRTPSVRVVGLSVLAAAVAFAVLVPGQLELLQRAQGDYMIAAPYLAPAELRGLPLFLLMTAAIGLVGARLSGRMLERVFRLDALSFFGYLAHPFVLGIVLELVLAQPGPHVLVMLTLTFVPTLLVTLLFAQLASKSKVSVPEALGAR